MSFDLNDAIRTTRPQRPSFRLTRRPDDELTWASEKSPIGIPLLLDTTVYLDVLYGRTPIEVDNLLRFRICNHSAICLGELTHAFGRLDPSHRETKSALKVLREVIENVPVHRLHAADSDIWGTAGMPAGALFRLSGLPRGQGHERKFLNDALLFLQARKLGCAVLTRNIRDFDFLSQLMANGRIIFYNMTAAS